MTRHATLVAALAVAGWAVALALLFVRVNRDGGGLVTAGMWTGIVVGTLALLLLGAVASDRGRNR
jgi:hypothetical protein